MAKPTKGNIKGAQQHAEGQHGRKTLKRLREMNATGRDAPAATHPEGTPARRGESDATRKS